MAGSGIIYTHRKGGRLPPLFQFSYAGYFLFLKGRFICSRPFLSYLWDSDNVLALFLKRLLFWADGFALRAFSSARRGTFSKKAYIKKERKVAAPH